MNRIRWIALSFLMAVAISRPAQASSLDAECSQLISAAGGGVHLSSQFYFGVLGNQMPPKKAAELAKQMKTVIARLDRLKLSDARTQQLRSSYVREFRQFVQRSNAWAINPLPYGAAIEEFSKTQMYGAETQNGYTSICIYKL
ncbi:hypothetical protein IQ250_12520 [Pseudanabaenaceae cyanobacterium LEGE 13415]|nr:hypothetical protein [Pseudanabaenaceae cyanobacterium LEGE 13415]